MRSSRDWDRNSSYGRILSVFASFTAIVSVQISQAANYVSSSIAPPKAEREFRAVWIATVNNIDWPSQKNLGSAEQKAELIKILDRASELNLNTVIFQVRPACDAMYASRIEPWSEYLTGTIG